MAYPAPVLRTAAILPRLRPDRGALLPAAFGTLAAALVLAREVSYGPGLLWDSINYVSVARSLLAGEGFTEFLGRPYTIWPPLYPLLLAAPGLLGPDPLDAAGPLNAAAHGLAVFAVARHLPRRLAARPLALWGGLAAALAMPLADMAALAMPETPFILLATLALLRLDAHLADGRRASLGQAAALAGLATLVRYPGVALLGPLLLLPALRPGVAPRERALRLAASAAIAAAPAALWALRRYLLTGEVGRAWPVDYGALDVLGGVLGGLGAWAYLDLPLAGERLATIPVAAAFLLALAGAVAASFARGRGEAHPAWRALRVHGVFAFSYVAMLAAATMLDFAWFGIQPRFLTPLYLPLLVAALAAGDRLLALERARARRAAAAAGRAAARGSLPAVLAVLSLWLAYEAAAQADGIRRANERPSRWETSEGLRYLRASAIGGVVHSNAAADVYVRTRTGIHRYLPAAADDVRRLAAAPPGEDGTWALWFHDVWSYRSPGWHRDGPDYGAPTLRGTPGLRPVAAFADGLLFRVDPSYDPPHGEAARALAAREPEARAAFGLHLEGGALTYLRAPCGEADVQARFFLHAVPADAGDLPEGRRRLGFANLDFAFEREGVIADGACMAAIALPAYPIASLRTGQIAPDGGVLWEAEIAVSP